MTLDAFLDEARAREVSEKQAKDIEPSESASLHVKDILERLYVVKRHS